MSTTIVPPKESKGVMTQEHFKMLFPTFTVDYAGGAMSYYEHNYTIENGVLYVYKVPKESWLRPKLEAAYKDWTQIQIHAE